jgi:hypothetical protein
VALPEILWDELREQERREETDLSSCDDAIHADFCDGPRGERVAGCEDNMVERLAAHVASGCVEEGLQFLLEGLRRGEVDFCAEEAVF